MAATSTLTLMPNQRHHRFHQKAIAPKPSSSVDKIMTLNMKSKNSKANKTITTPSSCTTSQSQNSVSSSVSTTTLLHNRISGAINNRGGRKNASGMIQHPTLGYPVLPPQPAKVARRNARERNRVKQVNSGFDHLRSHIPSAAKHKKMSKVDTLRHAVDYIESLTNMLKYSDETCKPGISITSSSGKASNKISPRASPENSEAHTMKNSPNSVDTDDFYDISKIVPKPEPRFEDSSDVITNNKPPPLSFHGQQQQQTHLTTSSQAQYTTASFIPNHQQSNHNSQTSHAYPLTPRTPNSPESGFVESTSGYETASNSYSNYMNYSGNSHSPNTNLMHPGHVTSSPDIPSLIMPPMTDVRHHTNSYHQLPPSNNVNTLLLPGATQTFQHHHPMSRLHDGRATSASPTSPSVYSDHSSAFINSSTNTGVMQQHHQQHHQPQQQLIELVPSVIGHPHSTNIDHHHNSEINSYFKYQESEMYTGYGDAEGASDEDDILDAIAKWQEN